MILENCSFASSAYKWDLDYLDKNLRDKGHIAYISTKRRFLYYDEDKMIDKYKDWKPPHQKIFTYFHEFMDMAKDLQKSKNGTLSYFQVYRTLAETTSGLI